MSFFACDEELAPPTFDTTTAKEKLLLKDWTYDYILMGTDTVKNLTTNGEPQTTGIFEAVELRYLRYEEDHSYQLRWEESVGSTALIYGVDDNYQPNLGYWYLSENGEMLIHNKLQTYEKQYEILELTENSFRRKLVGNRTSFLTNGQQKVLETITASWTEVFVPRGNPN